MDRLEQLSGSVELLENLGLVGTLYPAGSTAAGANIMDTSNNEEADISSEERSEISPRAEETTNTAEEGDGAGPSSEEENLLNISDEDFNKYASTLEMDMGELKRWFVETQCNPRQFKNFFEEQIGHHPLHVAAGAGAVDMVDMLINEAKVDVNIRVKKGSDYEGWTALHFAAIGNKEEMVYRLVTTYGADPTVHDTVHELNPLHVASSFGRADAVRGFLRLCPEHCGKFNVNDTDQIGRTALHMAVSPGFRWGGLLRRTPKHGVEVVHTLLKFPDIKLTIEDLGGRTALDLASTHKRWEVFNILRLKITSEVKDYNEPYYRDRQASVDAANAILVGAALIASVTFAAWLQPPLGYSTFYDEQFANSLPAPPTSNPQYASFDHQPMLKWFWAFNSLSFFLAIATVMSGAHSVLPSHRMTVKQEVAKLQRNLLVTSTLLALSMVFVLLAFAIAGVIVIPPLFNFRASMYFTIMIGGGVSGVFLVRLVRNIFYMARVMMDEHYRYRRFLTI